jgi:hypothetical protein
MKPVRWVAVLCLLWPAIAGAAASAVEPYNPASTPMPVRFESHEVLTKPVIDADHPDARGNKYGFEGGTVVKIDGTYHLFVAEMMGDPRWFKMRLALWTSPDAKQWKRVSTLMQTNGKRRAESGLPYESLWAAMPIYNDGDQRWDLFYVAYDRGEGGGGRIRRATSIVAGRGGIGGPYQDVGIILQPDAQSQPWEGGQGTDSFFPYRVKDCWYAFYGSHKVRWEVGLAQSPALAGPWKRCAQGNPVPIEKVFIENPIVTLPVPLAAEGDSPP